jgi:hypothetical protein
MTENSAFAEQNECQDRPTAIVCRDIVRGNVDSPKRTLLTDCKIIEKTKVDGADVTSFNDGDTS